MVGGTWIEHVTSSVRCYPVATRRRPDLRDTSGTLVEETASFRGLSSDPSRSGRKRLAVVEPSPQPDTGRGNGSDGVLGSRPQPVER
jgi:hypothetical protein